MAEIKWADDALDLMEEIYSIIRGPLGQGLERVSKLNKDLVKILSLLEDNPLMGVKLIVMTRFRTVLFNRYRLVYYYNKVTDIITIIAVFHVNFQQFDNPRNLHLPG